MVWRHCLSTKWSHQVLLTHFQYFHFVAPGEKWKNGNANLSSCLDGFLVGRTIRRCLCLHWFHWPPNIVFFSLPTIPMPLLLARWLDGWLVGVNEFSMNSRFICCLHVELRHFDVILHICCVFVCHQSIRCVLFESQKNTQKKKHKTSTFDYKHIVKMPVRMCFIWNRTQV